jgi:hypothetical protein
VRDMRPLHARCAVVCAVHGRTRAPERGRERERERRGFAF